MSSGPYTRPWPRYTFYLHFFFYHFTQRAIAAGCKGSQSYVGGVLLPVLCPCVLYGECCCWSCCLGGSGGGDAALVVWCGALSYCSGGVGGDALLLLLVVVVVHL